MEIGLVSRREYLDKVGRIRESASSGLTLRVLRCHPFGICQMKCARATLRLTTVLGAHAPSLPSVTFLREVG